MKWNSGYPKESGNYLVRFIWKCNGEDIKEVGVGRFYKEYGGAWKSVDDFDGEWWGDHVDVRGWLPIPEFGED